MKKNYLSPYEAPAIEIIEENVEQGFATSPEEGSGTIEDLLYDDKEYQW